MQYQMVHVPWKHVEIQIYIVIMCSIVLIQQVAGTDNVAKIKNK